MITTPGFEASVAEAAYIADISDRDVNRVVDEAILPLELFAATRGRRFPALACVLASFYFREEEHLTKRARQHVIWSFMDRCSKLDNYAKFLSLSMTIKKSEWEIDMDTLKVKLADYASGAQQRIRAVIAAESMVTTDMDVLAGEPVFKGTRIPVRTISAWMDADVSSEKIRDAYPAVTDDMLRITPIYVVTNPRRGRPPKFGELNTEWNLKSTSRVKLKRA